MITKILLVLVGIIAVASLAGTGFLFMQNKQLMDQLAMQNTNPQVQIVPTDSQPVDVDIMVSNDKVTATPSAPAAPQPPVIFTPGGKFNESLKAELNAKIVNPFIDYYANDQYFQVASVEISENTQASKATYPYLFNAISKTGGNQGFVISLPIDWWSPECMNAPCPMTPEYKAKYPAVAKKAGY